MPFADNDGIGIHYESYGRGFPLLLLHGSLMDARSWELAGYVGALASDYRLIAIDCRGAGASDKPMDPLDYEMDRYTSDVAAVAEHLGLDEFALWGFSWGGSIAWGVAESGDDRLRALIAMGCFTRAHLTDVETTEELRVGPLRRFGGAGFFDLAEPFEGPLPGWIRDQFAATDVEAYVAARRGAYSWSSLDAERVGVPTLLLNGGLEDPDRKSEEVARSMPDGRARIFEDLSHCRTFVASDLVVPVVRGFLQEVI